MQRLFLCFLLAITAGCTYSQTAPEELKTMKWNLRDALKMQLPNTEAENRNDRLLRKSYSFDTSKEEPATWEIPEKYFLSSNDSLVGGAKYFLLPDDIAPDGIQKIWSEDATHVAIVIRAKPGATFIFHPYSNERDSVVPEVRLGWWEPVQERTVDRVVVLMRDLLEKMRKG